MRSERWNIYSHIKIKNDLPPDVKAYTEKQWNEKGFVKVFADSGKDLQPCKSIKSKYTYLLEDEVREATDQEKSELAEQHRNRKRNEYKRRTDHNKVFVDQNMYLFENNNSQKETINNLSKSLSLKEQALEYANEKLNYYSKKSNLWTSKIYNISKAYSERYLSEHLDTVKKVIIVHTVTTGNDYDSEILEISIIDLNGITLLNEKYKPVLSNYIIHTEKKEITEDYERIQNLILESSAIIGYNTLFIAERLEFSGFYIPDNIQIIDLMIEFSELCKNKGIRNSNISLFECASYYGYEWNDNTSDSLEKCLATLYCYNMIHEKNDSVSI